MQPYAKLWENNEECTIDKGEDKPVNNSLMMQKKNSVL